MPVAVRVSRDGKRKEEKRFEDRRKSPRQMLVSALAASSFQMIEISINLSRLVDFKTSTCKFVGSWIL